MADKNLDKIIDGLTEEEKVEETETVEEPKQEEGKPQEEAKEVSFDERVDSLAKDEQQAIDSYDKAIAELQGEDNVVEQLKKIREEEVNHLKYLNEVKADHNLKYIDEKGE